MPRFPTSQAPGFGQEDPARKAQQEAEKQRKQSILTSILGGLPVVGGLAGGITKGVLDSGRKAPPSTPPPLSEMPSPSGKPAMSREVLPAPPPPGASAPTQGGTSLYPLRSQPGMVGSQPGTPPALPPQPGLGTAQGLGAAQAKPDTLAILRLLYGGI